MNSAPSSPSRPSVLVLGVGSFALSTAQILKGRGAAVATCLSREQGMFPPSLAGAVFRADEPPGFLGRVRELAVDLVIPQSIDWARQPWAEGLLAAGVGVLCPSGEGLRIERERDHARALCARYGVAFPPAHVVANLREAEALLARHPAPYVIKNPLCGPGSPVQTVVCDTIGATRSWLPSIDYAEGAFLQEFAGRNEAGHIVLVSDGEIHSLVTNQEYKRAFDGNLGIVAGAPLGGIVEVDTEDRYGLARELIHPLLPWLRAVNFHGPLQVTAVRRGGAWCVLEYNVRIGVTSGPMLLRLLANPLETLLAAAHDRPLQPRFLPGLRYGASVTLAGYGYPFPEAKGPPVPVEVRDAPPGLGRDCDLWWNDVCPVEGGGYLTAGPRLADAVGYGSDLATALARAYRVVRSLHSPGSYHRTDIGQSLWPPGTA